MIVILLPICRLLGNYYNISSKKKNIIVAKPVDQFKKKNNCVCYNNYLVFCEESNFHGQIHKLFLYSVICTDLHLVQNSNPDPFSCIVFGHKVPNLSQLRLTLCETSLQYCLNYDLLILTTSDLQMNTEGYCK